MQTIGYALDQASPAKGRFSVRHLLLVGISAASTAGAACGGSTSSTCAPRHAALYRSLGPEPLLHLAANVEKSYGDACDFLNRFAKATASKSLLWNAGEWPPSRLIHTDGKLFIVGNVQLISLNGGAYPFAL